MPQALPLITLLTDFGERDYFVASMKGVILTIDPTARIVDLSHEIPPHNIADAGHFLKSCYRYFPEGTIHLAVVDPGVGTTRQALLVSTARYYFIAPDNGLLSGVLERETEVEIRYIQNGQYRLQSEGSTFDGRDVFAPAAAWLAKGKPPAIFGPLATHPVLLTRDDPVFKNHALVGHIVYIDRFGNLISNITPKLVGDMQAATGRKSFLIHLAGHRINGVVRSYSEGLPGQACALINSNGYLEVFMKEGHAASSLGVYVGAELRLDRCDP